LSQIINISEIPALPESARIAISKTLSLEKSAEEIAKTIKENPSLTLKIIKIANSPLYTTRSRPVTNIKDAIILLGYKTVKCIILSVAIKDIFTDREHKWFDYRAYWVHSIATAVICEEIARILNNPSEEDAYAAGLLHDIGKVILLLSDEDRFKKVIGLIESGRLTFRDAERKVFKLDHSDISEFLFDYWKLPGKLIAPIQQHHYDPQSLFEKSIPESLTLKLANEIAHIAGFCSHPLEPPYEVSEEIIDRLGLINDDLATILKNLKVHITALVEVLNIQQTDIKGYFGILSSANRELGKMYLANQQIMKEIEEQKVLLSELNKLSLLFLQEKDVEKLLRAALRILLHSFNLESVSIEFYLNEVKSVFLRVFHPKMYTEDGKHVTSDEVEEAGQLIERGIVPETEKGIVYPLESTNGSKLGKLFLETEKLQKPKELKAFIDQFTLGLTSLKLYLSHSVKSEKLNIAVKRLKEENMGRQRALQFNRLILENSPIGIMSLDETGKIITYNKSAEGVFQQDLKDKVFFQLDLFVHNDLQKTVADIVRQLKSGILTAKRNGKQCSFQIELAAIAGTHNTLLLIQDISEKVENERMVIQKEKLSTLGELAAGIAHNLRSPLAVIKGIPEYILSELEKKKLRVLKKTDGREKEDTELRENMEMIAKSMEKAFAIIDSIMGFSKKESGIFEELDLRVVIDDAFMLLEHKLKEKKIKFISNTRDCVVRGNKNMLVQIFVNLLNNSIDAIEGSGTIEIEGRREDDKVVIDFIDSGIGIREDELEKIFEPFYSTSGKADGTGVGLSITRKMVMLHGGTIKAMQRPEGVSSIQISLPAKGNVHGKDFNS
jgi:PAS domain S-box-containing protein